MATIPNELTQGVLLFLFGALVTHVWNRYRARTRELLWSIQYLRVAVAADDTSFGRVDVLWNYIPVTNLYTARLEIRNHSLSDLADITINLACLDGTLILRSYGTVEGSLLAIPFTDAFSNALANPSQDNSAYVSSRRDYRIPVLNRDGKATFLLLLSRNDSLQPTVSIGCDYPVVKLQKHDPSGGFFGVPQWRAVVSGLLVSLAGILSIVWLVSSAKVAGLTGWILGVFSTALGILWIKFWRWLGRVFS